MNGIRLFPIDDFLVYFEEFSDSSKYTRASIQSCGLRAMHYIKRGIGGMPLPEAEGDRNYALFLMTAHIATLKNGGGGNGDGGEQSVGRVKKSTVGSVTVETDSPNGYLSNDVSYWLGQTQYGTELLAYLEMCAPLGAFINQKNDSVRVLT